MPDTDVRSGLSETPEVRVEALLWGMLEDAILSRYWDDARNLIELLKSAGYI